MNTYDQTAEDRFEANAEMYPLLENFGYDVEGLAELLRDEPISEVWEMFGSFHGVNRSARSGEYGVFEISDADNDHVISFLLPFDEQGELTGPGRIALENRHSVIESYELDIELSRVIWADVSDEIQEALPELSSIQEDCSKECRPDHRLWVEKLAKSQTDV
tara:strand:- start:306 stop:791 length:486 start_codon:yes stop_codon:yes gene_type:complete